MTYLSGRSPRAIAHRGWHTGDLAGLENSIAAFRRAVDEGYRYLETDVHTTSDGVLMAFHDIVLDRVTDGRGPIAALSYREVRQARIRGTAMIPTLAEVLEACPDAHFNIDPKSDGAVGPLLDVLGESGSWDRVGIGSFSDARLRTLRRAAPPGVATSLGPRQVAALKIRSVTGGIGSYDGAVAAQIPLRMGRFRLLTDGFVRAAHRAGLEIHAWTINDPDEMTRLLDIGVDGIITDRPDLLRDILVGRSQWQPLGEDPGHLSASRGSGGSE